jgi:hypothetical protein
VRGDFWLVRAMLRLEVCRKEDVVIKRKRAMTGRCVLYGSLAHMPPVKNAQQSHSQSGRLGAWHQTYLTEYSVGKYSNYMYLKSAKLISIHHPYHIAELDSSK